MSRFQENFLEIIKNANAKRKEKIFMKFFHPFFKYWKSCCRVSILSNLPRYFCHHYLEWFSDHLGPCLAYFFFSIHTYEFVTLWGLVCGSALLCICALKLCTDLYILLQTTQTNEVRMNKWYKQSKGTFVLFVAFVVFGEFPHV